MSSKSIRQAFEDAEAAAPQTGGGGVWDADTYELEIVNSNYKPATGNFPKSIGYQVQREDGKRRWFDFKLPDPDTATDKERAQKSLAASSRKLKALGLGPKIDEVDAAYPGDEDAQYTALVISMVGIRFRGDVVKEDKINSPKDKDGNATEFVNFMNKIELIEGTDVAAPAGLSGLSGLSPAAGQANIPPTGLMG